MYDPIPRFVNTDNLALATDSYKLNHWNQYPPNTQTVYSYLESRPGAAHPYTVFFGLQYILKHYLEGGISWDDLAEASELAAAHFGAPGRFNYQAWSALKSKYGNKLPLRLKAVAEGSVIPTGNVLLTVENTDPDFFWLTNYVESLLLHVWYPTTVATRSRAVKQMLSNYLDETSTGDKSGLPFMLHDFGYRGVSSHESAMIGGAAHLVNFVGTDTLPAMLFAKKYYDASYDTLAFSVPATEHSVMTAMGEDGEHSVIDRLLDEYPAGILSVVNDSYNYQRHVDWLCTDFKDRILAREGVFVTRPDSTPTGMTPADVVIDIANRFWHAFGGETNAKGYKVLDPHVRILWGDGIEPDGIESILKGLAFHSFSAENMATFGMGGGLLQKVNRDTEHMSIKSSAQERDGVWYDISKSAPGKFSKAGKLALIERDGTIQTVPWSKLGHQPHDLLQTVFENGEIVKTYTFDEVRANAALV
jgi:nicotinamide phosphoribosyltransferase